MAKPPSGGLALAESIPPSTRKLFDLLGVRAAMDAAGFVRSTGNTVWWGGDAGRTESFPNGERGWQVTADRLESLLYGAAVEAGVSIGEGTVASEISDAAFTLDCTGRSGVVARSRRLRQPELHHHLVALVGLWRSSVPFALPDPTHTAIESYANGWAWSVPDDEGRRFVAVMVDPQSSQLARGEAARAVYLAEIGKTSRFRALLQSASLEAGPAGWDASMYSASRYVEDTTLLVGDAASFIDPLSSAGVKKALASAWLAAVAVHTSLVRPEMRRTALDFYNAREAEVYQAFRTLTARHLADAAPGHPHPFWNDRAEVDGMAMGDALSESAQSAVARAFERIRHAPSLTVRRAPDVRTEARPAVSGCDIVLEERLVSDLDPQGLRDAYDVDLVTLIDLAPRHDSVPDLFEAYQRRSGPAALPDFLAALATLVARGWLRALE